MLSFYRVLIQCLRSTLARPSPTFRWPGLYSARPLPSRDPPAHWLHVLHSRRANDLLSIESTQQPAPIDSLSPDILSKLF